MDRAKIFKDYFVSRQNTVLLPSEDFGRRKFINVGINRSLSLSRIEELQYNHTDPDMRSSNKQWLHSPDALTRGHILYTVKFLGESECDAPKGTDVVKDAIRKRKFNKTIKKTEGQKTPKVELAISIDGVTIQEPKTKITKHQYPLHRISYCADDKTDKRMFTFIAKGADTQQHYCYVFASDKNAEEITLTIGQAFDLAYRRFLETQNKDIEAKKKPVELQKKVDALEKENAALKQRIRELERLKDRPDVENYKRNKQISDLTTVTTTTNNVVNLTNHAGESTTDSPISSQPGSPSQNAVGRRLENLVFDGTSATTNGGTNGTNGAPMSPLAPGIISPPPPSTRSRSHKPPGTVVTPTTPATPTSQQAAPPNNNYEDDLASVFMSPNVYANTPLQQNNFHSNNVFNPFNTSSPASTTKPADPFGMPTFVPNSPAGASDGNPSGMSSTNKDFLDLQAGFSSGLSFGTEEFGMGDMTGYSSLNDSSYNDHSNNTHDTNEYSSFD